MADLPQQDTLRQYQADGVTTTYTYPFLILLDSDISVYVTLAGDTPNPTNDIKILGVDYSVINAGNINGGTIVFTVAPPLASIVTLQRTMQISIDTEFALAQNFNGGNLDDAFERVTLFTQQTNTLLNDRALQYIVNSYLPNVNSNQIPTLGNGQVWSGLNGAVIATDIETDPNISLLRSQLASTAPLGEGALLVGYYDTIDRSATNIGSFLDYKDIYGTDTGVADAMVVNIPNSNFAYKTGQIVRAIVANDNVTTTPTINVNGKGAVVIMRNPSSAAQTGDLSAGTIVELVYDRTANKFYIVNLFIAQVSPLAPTLQSFTISGSSGTYTTPSGVVYIDVFGVGGGGSSGSCAGGSGLYSCSSGGSGGGYFFKRIISPLSTYAYSIGSGGAISSPGNNNGQNGTATTFGTSFLVGSGGIAGSGGRAFTSAMLVGGSPGGTATGGDINIQGNCGGMGTAFAGVACVGGPGGSTPLGGSAQGYYIASTGNGQGTSGLNYGGGGSGSVSYSSAPISGAAGAGGAIFVREYYV